MSRTNSDDKFKLIKTWATAAGYEAAIVEGRFSSIGNSWLNGYVGIAKDHPLFNVDYSTPCTQLLGIENVMGSDELKYARPECVIDVHGGLTYSGGHPSGEESDLFWFGFDCNHANDDRQKCDETYVTEQCENMANQLYKLKDIGSSGGGKHMLKDNEVVIFKCELEALTKAAQALYDIATTHGFGGIDAELFKKLIAWGFISESDR
jgi:hypothetical protein